MNHVKEFQRMTPGKLYLIRGGHIVRYQGPGLSPYIGADDVLREVTVDSARFLRVRLVQALVRNLTGEAEWVQDVMAEVGVTIHPYVIARFKLNS